MPFQCIRGAYLNTTGIGALLAQQRHREAVVLPLNYSNATFLKVESTGLDKGTSQNTLAAASAFTYINLYSFHRNTPNARSMLNSLQRVYFNNP
jgi:hypothetical protein